MLLTNYYFSKFNGYLVNANTNMLIPNVMLTKLSKLALPTTPEVGQQTLGDPEMEKITHKQQTPVIM